MATSEEDPVFFVAVHAGAGFHSAKRRKDYEDVMARACLSARDAMRLNGSCVEGVVAAIKVLEGDPITNAGEGSTLNLHGKVEADASIVRGRDNGSAAVGAAPGLRHPIEVAHAMLKESDKGLLSGGRIPPVLLVGSGAREWAETAGLAVSHDSEYHVTDRSKRTWAKHRELCGLGTANDVKVQENASKDAARNEHQEGMPPGKRAKREHGASRHDDDDDRLHDTVGAICYDASGNVAAGVSSGGISLKHPGRVGEAAALFCGCWADSSHETLPRVACSTTGMGELIMKARLASSCCEHFQGSDTTPDDAQAILQQGPLSKIEWRRDRDAGFILLKVEPKHNDDSPHVLEFVASHTTPSMAVAYLTTGKRTPKATVLHKAESSSPQSVNTFARMFRL